MPGPNQLPTHIDYPLSRETQNCMWMSTTVDGLMLTATDEEKSQHAAQFVATGRKTWKTVIGKGEAVWSAVLEAALLEGLNEYHAEYSADSNTDRPFPKRYKYISDYILVKTGKRRTPKQVGSRLQQLRDTSKGREILQLLTHGISTQKKSYDHLTLSEQPTQPSSTQNREYPTNLLNGITYITISLQNDLWPFPTPCINLARSDSEIQQSQTIQLAPLPSPPSGRNYYQQTSHTILPFLQGFVQLVSPFALSPLTTFTIYVDGDEVPIHYEEVELTFPPSPNNINWLYGSDIAPEFWEMLCSVKDATQYTILQSLKPMNNGDVLSNDGTLSDIYIFYTFKKEATTLVASSASTYISPFNYA